MSQILKIAMKMLTVSAVLCAMVALTTAAEARDEVEGLMPPAKSHVVKRSPRCPGGWTKYGHRCFFFNSTVASWADAEKCCLIMGAHLTSVRNINEYREIQRLTGKKESWIGGTDASEFSSAGMICGVMLICHLSAPRKSDHSWTDTGG